MIGTTIGNYKIIDKIGEGGMGVVYLAEHIKLGRRFAVKCLAPELTIDPKFRDRFEQEGKNQARLEHPNIVQVTDSVEQDGHFFLVMEYVDGQELDNIIKAKEKIPEKEALAIFKDILKGLNFAHSKGVIHRDIKPPNILVDKNGRVRIMDFGIAILAGEKRLTATGRNIGSPWYMSPEQIKKPRETDHRSDVYSAGIVLYEMLTGEVPFDSDTDSDYEVKEKHINKPVPDPIQKNPQISKPLAQIILKALEKNPDDRFNGCGEFLRYIEEYEKGEQINCPYCNAENRIPFGKLLREVECSRCGKSLEEGKNKRIWVIAAILILFSMIAYYIPREKDNPSLEKSSLIITTEPTNADIVLKNDKVKRKSPLTLSLQHGKYEIVIKKDGYYEENKQVQLEKGKQIQLSVNLRKIEVPEQKGIVINTVPQEADIFINNQYQGKSRLEISLQTGEYEVRIRKDGYYEEKTKIRIEKAGKGTFDIPLKPIPVTKDDSAEKTATRL